METANDSHFLLPTFQKCTACPECYSVQYMLIIFLFVEYYMTTVNVLSSPDQPSTDGYIAVILPKLEESKTVTKGLLTREEYEDVISKRNTQPQESL